MIMKSIFEIENRIDIEAEYEKLFNGFFTDNFAILLNNGRNCSLVTYLNVESFLKWNYRDTSISVKEYLEKLGINFILIEEYSNYQIGEEEFLYFIEFFLNMFFILRYDDKIRFSNRIKAYQENLKLVLEKMNYEPQIIEDRIIIRKRDADADSILELVEEDIAGCLLEYNDFRIRNDIEAKKKILKKLDLYIEKNINLRATNNKDLDDTIGTIINKMGINHPINEKPFSTFTDEELLEWYDRCFLLMIHAIRTKEVEMIKDERKKLVQ